MKEWEKQIDGNTIKVENKFNSEKLFVNDELQDERIGAFAARSVLWGKLPDGRQVKATLGGTLTVSCLIFVDDKLI